MHQLLEGVEALIVVETYTRLLHTLVLAVAVYSLSKASKA